MNIFNQIFSYWAKGGWLMIPLALLCLFIWYYFLKMNIRLKKVLAETNTMDDILQENVFSGTDFSKPSIFFQEKHFIARRLLTYVMKKLHEGRPAPEIFYEIKQKELLPYERDITILKALVVAAPLMGLLGTVLGMISTFDAIAEKSSDTTALMASGISQGLLTTEFGLIIAIPGLFGLSLIRKKMEQWESRLTTMQLHLSEGVSVLK